MTVQPLTMTFDEPTVDAVLVILAKMRRKARDDGHPWEQLVDDGSRVLILPAVACDWRLAGVKGHPPLAMLDEAWADAEAVLRQMEADGLLEIEWTIDTWRDPPQHHAASLWFRGRALEVLGSVPRPPQVRRKTEITEALRYSVLERDDFECVLCGATEDLTLDHIIPVVMGGSDDALNLRVLCRPCNSAKGIGLPDHIRLLRPPPRDDE